MPQGLTEAIDQLLKADERLNNNRDDIHFYTGYFHTLYAKLLFIHSITSSDKKSDMVLMMPLTFNDLEIPAVVESLKSLSAAKIHYWNGDYWKSIKKTETAYLASEAYQRSIVIMNPFPLDHKIYLELLKASGPMPVAGSTGDHSLFEVISSGRLPFHEYMPYQRMVNENLASAAGSSSIKMFFSARGYLNRARALRQLKKHPELIQSYLMRLNQKYNATPFLIEMVKQSINNDSSLWAAIRWADQRLENGGLNRPAISELEALICGRGIMALVRELADNEQLTDSERLLYRQRIDKYSFFLLLNYPRLQQMLFAISDKIIGNASDQATQ
ncbi:hypothetical protein GZ77_16020 [Endozoicomonas montiporae]|uniref:Uncharacterized protein n=2 Tax=Endozoicomonas montiporae TaxID=1027273 RepID=A0A081N5R5_9GAMM|nr:hypothetical protein GZ77_16020 [Endozoicomonas montiporae]